MKLLVVNAMLLTGFDAPPVQALFLDRGLRGHTLMQAISRTNRTYPGKDSGLVFDYWGVFDGKEAAKVVRAAVKDKTCRATPVGLVEGRYVRWKAD